MDGDNDAIEARLQRIRILRLIKLRQRRRRRMWVRPVLAARDELGEFSHLVSQLRSDPAAHQQYLRLTPAEFDYLLGLVRDDIAKEVTNMRRPIPPDERLALTLRVARLASRYPRDLVIDRCRGGATWTTVLKNLQDDLLPWLHAKDTFHLEPGHIIIWLSGNDSHSRSTGLGRISDELNLQVKVSVRETLLRLSEKQPAAIIVLGPLPRPGGQVSGLAWEKTASSHQERATKEAIESAKDLLHCPATLVLLGRALTKKSGGRHSVTAECQGAWYKPDGVHLNAAGYAKMADLLPVWLRLA
ncbi:hypothetical protein FJT64_007247 [Amphibalanus amphitrite]|uniref:SGNH hydrolase-type esterase domain-containing protein n=1 Tax=Amphibalanus amphitrite TaxID=1232801 RepID=A0A6A4VLY3_AMPAM|nr:hypothetical protein FJT64_007247 [Amphibalanus amphitrite]